jgi:glucose/mannose transport system substrate-binding protein
MGTLLVFGLLSVLVVPARASATEPAAGRRMLTFYHWWTAPSEAAALNALIAQFNKKYPDVTVSATVVLEHDVRTAGLFSTVSSNVRAHRPPDAFQMDAGYAAQPFFDAGLLSPIDDVWASEGLARVIPPFIAEMSKYDGHSYSVPVGVHRMNVVWCNRKLLDKHQIKPSTLTTWDAFFKAAETLRAGGVRYPIQMGESWTANHVFQCIIASLGLSAYEDWMNGKITAADDPRLLSALKILARYLSYVNADNAGLDWSVATQRVIKGEGAFCIMGDWANGEFKHSGLKYGEGYEAFPVPGTAGLYGVNVDAFQHPRGIADETNAKRWLTLAASREGQDAFNPLKGSVSARTDADVSKYDPYQRSAIADMKVARPYPALGQGAPSAFADRMDDILGAYAADKDAARAASAIAAAAAKLSGRFTRTWSLK